VTDLYKLYKDYRIMETAADMLTIQIELARKKVKATAARYYFTWQMLISVEEMLEKSFSVLERYRKDAENFVDSGAGGREPLLELEIELARAKKKIEKIRKEKDIIVTAISMLMGRDKKDVNLKKTDPEFLPIKRSFDEVFSFMNSSSETIKIMERGKYIVKLKKEASISEVLPSAAFVAGYTRDFSANEQRPEGTFYAGVSASWNFGSNFFINHNEYQKAKAYEVRTTLNNELLKKQMFLDIKSEYAKIKTLETEIAISAKEISSAEEHLRIIENKYRLKVITEKDLIRAIDNLRRAGESLISVSWRHHIALYNLAEKAGISIMDLTI